MQPNSGAVGTFMTNGANTEASDEIKTVVPIPLGFVSGTKIGFAEANVLAAGQVIRYSESPIVLELYNENSAILKVVCYFPIDERGGRTETVSKGKSELEFRFYNVNQAYGSGVDKPIRIGELAGNKVSARFAFMNLTPYTTIFFYTFYVEHGV